jgi:hypothetical protein
VILIPGLVLIGAPRKLALTLQADPRRFRAEPVVRYRFTELDSRSIAESLVDRALFCRLQGDSSMVAVS